MVQDMVNVAKPKMEAAYTHFLSEAKTLRTGAASAQLVDHIMVPYYGSMTPIKALASITTPEPQQILITPFDAGSINDIRQGIIQAELGLNPSDDGRVMRINIPPLTTERREELVKKLNKMAEEARISVRTARGESWETIQEAQKKSEISEDNRDYGRDALDKMTSEFNKKIEETTKEKETEIRTV